MAKFLCKTLLVALQCLWLLPISVLGLGFALLVSLLGFKRLHLHALPMRGSYPALWLHSPALTWTLHHHPMGRMRAVTVGDCVLAAEPPDAHYLVLHELEHVRQGRRWGLIFPWAYLLAGLWQAARGGNMYWDNPFEVAARAAENCRTSSD
jgi:Zn-dependent protease